MNKDNILVIYGHENLYATTGQGSDLLAYYVHFLIDNDGIIHDKDFLLKLYDNLLVDEQKSIYVQYKIIGPFHIFGELEEFCLKISDHYKRKDVRMLSVADYNEIAMEAHSREQFVTLMQENSIYIEREGDGDRKGFFSNFFS